MKAATHYWPRRGSFALQAMRLIAQMGRPMSTAELVAATGTKQNALWQKLNIAEKRGGLVVREAIGRVNWYRLPFMPSVLTPVEPLEVPALASRLRPCPDITGLDPRACWPFGAIVRTNSMEGL